MASAIFWHKGDTIDRTNDTEAEIEANTIQVIGSRIGIVGGTAAIGEQYSVNVVGVYKMPKVADEAITAGTIVYFSATTGTVSATKQDDGIQAGFVTVDAAASDSYACVKINA